MADEQKPSATNKELFSSAPPGKRYRKDVESALEPYPGHRVVGLESNGLVIGDRVYRRSIAYYPGWGGPDTGWRELTFSQDEAAKLAKQCGWKCVDDVGAEFAE